MIVIVMVLFVLTAAMAQMVAPDFAFLGHARPPFLLAVASYYAMKADVGFALFAALAAGTLQDVASSAPLGYSAACFMAAVVLLAIFKKVIRTDSFGAIAFVGSMVAFGADLALYLLLLRSGSLGQIGAWQGLRHAVGTAVTGAFVIPMMSMLIGALDRLAGNERCGGENLVDAD